MGKQVKILCSILIALAVCVPPVSAQTVVQSTAARFAKAGMDQIKAGDYRAARESFEQAVREDDSFFAAHLGLGMAAFHLRDDSFAERELLHAIELNPDAALTYQFLGEIYYRKDDLETAAQYWEKAVERDASNTALRTRLDRIRREHNAEKDFNRDVTSHFLIKYEGREKIEAGRIILRILEDAYGELGRALSYYPDQEIQVILYSGQQFKEVTDAPGWIGGVFDGKIRLPVGGIETESPGLRKLLYHEYTHAVVRALAPRCPTWLNEGLAQYFEGREIGPEFQSGLRRMAKEGRLLTLSSLEGSFINLGSVQGPYAYLISLSSVRYMVDSFGMYRVRTILDELGKGANIGKAVSGGIMISYEEFERGWTQSLE
jgi:hypothetical protein